MPDIRSPQANKPAVPTMTNDSLIPKLEPVTQRPGGGFAPPEELGEDITAIQLGTPDFANDIKPYLTNPNLHPRWIFTDRRRFSQALAQGWRVAKKADLKIGYAKLTPFEEEGGTKYINGDLILMLIDRKTYLGALRYKHQVAAALSDAAVQRRISAGRAVNEMGSTVAAVNAKRAQSGADPVMTVFAPGVADLSDTILGQPGVASKEGARLGGSRDMGTLQSLADQAKDSTT